MNDTTKNVLLWAVIALVLVAVLTKFMPPAAKVEEITYSTFLTEVHEGKVDKVVLQGDEIYGDRKDKSKFQAYNPETNYTALIGELSKANVGIEGKPPPQPSFLTQLLLSMAPALLLILVFVYMLRQMQGAGGGRGAMSFGKSRARLLGEDQVNVTFADVAGVDEAKQEVGEI
ncbi:MAG: ATP-dependent metallopeptidase FtsH/Yme1/Tma family protein, partial [Proteobacteria bacterium]|nr:ATP-dependent metallopeptidase FtsH/Yme1/Tma family protein [Pseudomonadota bacterium]